MEYFSFAAGTGFDLVFAGFGNKLIKLLSVDEIRKDWALTGMEQT